MKTTNGYGQKMGNKIIYKITFSHTFMYTVKTNLVNNRKYLANITFAYDIVFKLDC